jgi:hypothetical protein
MNRYLATAHPNRRAAASLRETRPSRTRRDTLLPKLLRGEVSVSHVERFSA